MKTYLQRIVLYFLLSFATWLGISSLIFAVDHPWMTDTQRMMHIGDALMFRKIPR